MNTSKIWTDYDRDCLEKAVKLCTSSYKYGGKRKPCVNWDKVARMVRGGEKTGVACHVEYNKIHKGER